MKQSRSTWQRHERRIAAAVGVQRAGIGQAGADVVTDDWSIEAKSWRSLPARVVAALSGWTPTESGLGEPSEEGAEFEALDPEESKTPAGTFTARFSILCLAGLGAPYAA